MSGNQKQRMVDQSALKVNQAFIIALLAAAFIFDSWPIAAFVGAVMLLGAIIPSLSLFNKIYLHILKPLNWVKPNVTADNPESHLFAQGFGGTVLFLAVLSILSGLNTFGLAACLGRYRACQREFVPGVLRRLLLLLPAEQAPCSRLQAQPD